MSMDSYITEAIDKFTEEITKTIKAPAGNHIFKVDNTCVKLCKRDKIILHMFVAKIILLIKREKPYIQLTIEFLTMRLRNPDEDNWKKL